MAASNPDFKAVPKSEAPSVFRSLIDRLRGFNPLKAYQPPPIPQKRPDYLTCEVSPDGTLNFTEKNPFGPEEPMTINGEQEPNGRITGQRSGIDADGKPYIVRTGEPGLAPDTLEHETLPRIAQKCRDTFKP
jgi:hypothetical protein